MSPYKSVFDGFTTEELIREAMRRCFTHVDLKDPSLLETPKRVAKMWQEFDQACDVAALLKRSFDNAKGSKSLVVQTGIPVAALCEHHLAPFFGVAHVGYLPKDRVVGLSKLTRLVKGVCHTRPTVQETATRRIARLLYEELGSLGSIVVMRCEHTCMSVRGVAAPGVATTTSAIEGLLRDSTATRQEFFELIRLRGVNV